MSVPVFKSNLVQELFVRTADENYITARWCAIHGLNTDFLWLSVHALEKYYKAVLLENGRTSKGYSHNIVKLHAAVKQLAGTLIPDKLEKPNNLDTFHWRDRTVDEFVKHLLDNGNADNRYLIYGYTTHFEDLHMLDAVVFAIRRLICPLDEPITREANTPTHRQVLTAQLEYYGRLFMPLDDAISGKPDNDAQMAALNLNLAFAPAEFPHADIRASSTARNPVILRRILDPLGSADANVATEGVELARWFLDNVQVPRGTAADPGVLEQINAAISAAQARHNIP